MRETPTTSERAIEYADTIAAIVMGLLVLALAGFLGEPPKAESECPAADGYARVVYLNSVHNAWMVRYELPVGDQEYFYEVSLINEPTEADLVTYDEQARIAFSHICQ